MSSPKVPRTWNLKSPNNKSAKSQDLKANRKKKQKQHHLTSSNDPSKMSKEELISLLAQVNNKNQCLNKQLTKQRYKNKTLEHNLMTVSRELQQCRQMLQNYTANTNTFTNNKNKNSKDRQSEYSNYSKNMVSPFQPETPKQLKDSKDAKDSKQKFEAQAQAPTQVQVGGYFATLFN